ncbi:MAG: YbgC/FadM family acyl-CoA thioesterase [Comamonadaceae bacterium]|nr:MAG: YbgC/FadM family acyl-CoA thioesterase [Comamonadaceae bacterium]
MHDQAPEATVFSWPLRIYWEDTDAGGIVFYANYLKFFERSRTEWLRSLGIGQQRLKDETGGMFVVVETGMRYHRPARLDDELIVTAQLVERGRASLTIGQQALLKVADVANAVTIDVEATASPAPVLLCEGTIRISWVTAATMQPGRIPAGILDCFK